MRSKDQGWQEMQEICFGQVQVLRCSQEVAAREEPISRLPASETMNVRPFYGRDAPRFTALRTILIASPLSVSSQA